MKNFVWWKLDFPEKPVFIFSKFSSILEIKLAFFCFNDVFSLFVTPVITISKSGSLWDFLEAIHYCCTLFDRPYHWYNIWVFSKLALKPNLKLLSFLWKRSQPISSHWPLCLLTFCWFSCFLFIISFSSSFIWKKSLKV